MLKMKLGLIGVGVVGTAVKKAFENFFDVVCYDKFREEFSNLTPLLNADVIFVCVPTPTLVGQDLSAVDETCQKLSEASFPGIVILKSTMLPGSTLALSQVYPNLRLVHYPEFLTEAKANDDFLNQQTVILGGNTSDITALVPLFQVLNRNMHFEFYGNTTTTEMIKYVHNTFLATKVEFFNEIYDLCQRLKINYNFMMLGVDAIGQVGKNHTKVPGPDGKFGYGGSCFPKDTKALLEFSKIMAVSMPVLAATISGNERRRCS